MTLTLHSTPSNPKQSRIFLARPTRWLQVLSHLDPSYGGMSTAVPELGQALAHDGRCTIDLAAFCAPGEHYKPANVDESNLSYWPAGRGSWLHNRPLHERFNQKILLSDGIHIHGLWEQSTAVASKLARQAHKPYILSAHGMLERWALRKKRLKKLLYSALIERATVDGAACLHALTHAEAEDYRRFGARGPIVVLPNGVDLPNLHDASSFLKLFPSLSGKRIVLFLGRLHTKKGVDLLVKAWAQVASHSPEAHLVMAGPDAEGTQRALEQLVAQHHLQHQVTFPGMLRDELKWSALAAAEGFVLPSHSEGLSVSVLEAMGMGLPVIVTAQCNMPEVPEHQAGWQIQPELTSLVSALKELLHNSPAANAAIGRNGSRLVEEQFNWTSVAERMADVYSWVQGGPKPHTVDLILR